MLSLTIRAFQRISPKGAVSIVRAYAGPQQAAIRWRAILSEGGGLVDVHLASDADAEGCHGESGYGCGRVA